jgi:anti-sigma B factor antagonist
VIQISATSVEYGTQEVTVALHGEIDVLTVEQVRLAITEAVAAGPKHIVVDLADLSFIDSTGIGAIVFGLQRSREHDIGFRLARPSGPVHQVLLLSGLLDVVEVVDPPPPVEGAA